MTSARRERLAPFALFALFAATSLICFWKDLFVAFYWDDPNFVVRSLVNVNPSLLEYLSATIDRPVSYGLLWLNSQFAHGWAPGYRLVTLLFHAGTGYILFRMLRLLARRHLKREGLAAPLVLSLLYVAHPAHNQAIQIVAERSVILASFFSLIAFQRFALHLESRSRRDYVLSFLALTLAVFSKGFAIATPPIIALYVLAFYPKRLRAAIPRLAPLAIVSLFPFLLYVVFSFFKQVGSIPTFDYFAVELRVIWTYFRLFLLPIHLRHFYHLEYAPNAWSIVAGLAHLIVIAAAALALRKPATRVVGFGLLAAYLALAPESSVMAIRFPIWEYRTYFPFVFLFVALLPALQRLLDAPATRSRQTKERAAYAATVAILAVASILNAARAEEVMTPSLLTRNTLQYEGRDEYIFYCDYLSAALRGQADADTAPTVEAIRRELADVPDVQLYGLAFDLTAMPPGPGQDAALERLANSLRDRRDLALSTRGNLDNLVLGMAEQRLQGGALFEKGFELLLPQLLAISPQALMRGSATEFADLSVATVRALRNHYTSEKTHRDLKPAELARELWLDAVLDIYFGQPQTDLPARFERFLARHPEGARTRAIFEWYQRARSSR